MRIAAHTLPPPYLPACLALCPLFALHFSGIEPTPRSSPLPWGSFVYFIFCKLSLLCHGQAAVCHAPGKGAQFWHNWTGQLEAAQLVEQLKQPLDDAFRISLPPSPYPSQGLKMINWQLLSGIMFFARSRRERKRNHFYNLSDNGHNALLCLQAVCLFLSSFLRVFTFN